MKETVNFHGSDIEKVAKYYGLNQSDIHNYSGNVNPLGLSPTLADKLKANIHLVTSYPDPDYVSLKESIGSYTSTSPNHVLLGNGSTELIAHYIDYVSPKKAMIVGPTYSEYEKKIRTLKAEVHYHPLSKDDDFRLDIDDLILGLTQEMDLLVLCNPNNPTASMVTAKDLYPLFDHCKAYGIYILIDETYMDFVENHKTISALPLTNIYNNCIVLRGFSKFFSAPGLRLGYGITSDMNCHRALEKQRHHWSINSLSAFAGKELISDEDFINTSMAFITKERIRILRRLGELDKIIAYPSYVNFFFVELLDENHSAHSLFEFMIRKGLMIRDTSSFPFLHNEFFRFCILSEEENDELLDALEEYLLQ